jgi:hypothetical protein
MTREIFVENYESGVLTDATEVVLSDITATYGIREKDTGTVVVAAGTATTKSATGVYEYDISALDEDTEYEYVFKIMRTSGDIEYVEGEIPIVSPSADTAYCTVDEAQSYFDGRLNADAWDDASSANKEKSLIHATRLIERLNFKGEKTVDTQDLQFPRDNDTSIPDDIKYACSEIALALLDGIDPELEFDNLKMVSQGYANTRSTYNPDLPVEHIAAGIPSVMAWRFLKPYLRDMRTVNLSRVN